MDRRGIFVLGLLAILLSVSPSKGDEVFDPKAGTSGISVEQPLDLQSIRVAAISSDRNIAIVRAQREEFASTIDKAISAFDPIVGLGLNGSGTDRQNRSLIQGFGSNSVEQERYSILPGTEQNQFYLRQRNTLGGQGTIGFTSEYLSLDPTDPTIFFNPGWDSRLRFRYTQPFLKGAGREVNEAPIVIAQQRTNQTTYSFNASVQKLLLDVESAYWDWQLAWSLGELLKEDENRSGEVWKREREALKIGTGTVGSEAQARERFHRSRIRRIQGESLARIGQQKLQRVAGLPAINQIVYTPANPADSIRPAPSLDQAISGSYSRPELRSQQAAIVAAEAQIRIAQNGLQPDFSMLFDYSMLGLQERFDDSISTLADFKFYEWTVGVQYQQPLYWRGERADLRQAQWFAARQRRILDQLQHMATHEVAEAYEQLRGTSAQLEVHDERIVAAERDVEANDALYKNRSGTLNAVIEAQDRLLEAKTDRQIAQANHQKAISALMYASGLMLGDQIIVEEDLPEYDLPSSEFDTNDTSGDDEQNSEGTEETGTEETDAEETGTEEAAANE